MANGLEIGRKLLNTGSLATIAITLLVYGSARFLGSVSVEQGFTGSGGTLQVNVAARGGSETGHTVFGVTMMTTEVSQGGCTSTGNLAKYNTCLVNTGSYLHPRNRISGTASGVIVTEVVVVGRYTPGGSFNIDITFPRDASGEAGTGSRIDSHLNNITVNTGSKFRIAFSGAGIIWDHYSSAKVATSGTPGANAVFRVFIFWMEDFE